MEPAPRGFIVDEVTGVVTANRSAMDVLPGQVRSLDLKIRAKDSGKKPLSTTVSVRINVGSPAGAKTVFSQREFRYVQKLSGN